MLPEWRVGVAEKREPSGSQRPDVIRSRLRTSSLPYSDLPFHFQGNSIPSARNEIRDRRRGSIAVLGGIMRSDWQHPPLARLGRWSVCAKTSDRNRRVHLFHVDGRAGPQSQSRKAPRLWVVSLVLMQRVNFTAIAEPVAVIAQHSDRILVMCERLHASRSTWDRNK